MNLRLILAEIRAADFASSNSNTGQKSALSLFYFLFPAKKGQGHNNDMSASDQQYAAPLISSPAVDQTHNVGPSAASEAAAAQEHNEEMMWTGPMLRDARQVDSKGRDVSEEDEGTIPMTITSGGSSKQLKLTKNQFKNFIWFVLCPCLLLCPSVCKDDDTDNWRMNPIEPKKGNSLLACRLLCCPCLEPRPTTTTNFSGHPYQYDIAVSMQ